MQDNSFLESQYFVSWHETDIEAQLTLKSISDFLMETAWRHAAKLGFGYEDLHGNDYAWLLSRIHIEIDQFPKWKDNITVRTWPVKIDRLFAIRHFYVYDDNRNILVKAGTYWLVVDQEKHRPVRPENVFKDKVRWSEDEAVGEIEKIDTGSAGKILRNHKVSYSDIDFYKHVTNSKYTELILNSIPFDKFKGKAISNYQVNYLAETRWDDELVVFADEMLSTIKVVRTSDEKEVVHARIWWD